MRKNRVQKTCITCARTFEVPASWDYRKNCSQECYSLYQQAHPSNTGRTWFQKGMVPLNRGLSIPNPEHANKIQHAWKRGVYANRPRHSFETRKKISATQQGMTVDKWGGFSTSRIHLLRKTPEYIAWRKAVFGRDNFTCQCCGAKGVYIEAHHIKSFTYFPELRHDVDNGITYCLQCHIKHDVHRGGNKIPAEVI